MSEDRRSILTMLAEGKITADEADRLLSALERGAPGVQPGAALAPPDHNRPQPKYLRVTVDSDEEHGGPTKVNVRVPMQLLRAGVRTRDATSCRAVSGPAPHRRLATDPSRRSERGLLCVRRA